MVNNINKRLGFMQGRLVEPEKKNSIQYFPEKNWKNEFKIASENNFKIIEWTINNENLNKNPLYNGKIEIVKKLIKKYKFKIPSITNDYFMQKPFFRKENIKEKNIILENLKKIIKNGNKVGVKYHIYPLVDNSSINSEKDENLLVIGVKELIQHLNKNSKILFETDYRPNLIKNFIEKFDSKKIGINYDTGNSAGLNYDFSDEIKYFKYVNNIHIKDRILYGKTIRLGKGNWKYKKFFKLLKKNDYKGNFILQTARNSKSKHIEEILINKNFFINEFK